MPRIARFLVDKGYYHVITRGIDRRRLFRYKQDYMCFLKITKKYLAKFNISITNYCLMPNHLHLLIYAQNSADLPKFMQAVLQVYANYFRKKYQSVGFVFQNRYKSRFINKDSYLLECARYIERNPLRAGITNDLLSYSYSSFSFYASGIENDIIKNINAQYLGLANTEQERQEMYFNYISEERPYEHIVDKEFKIR